MGEDVSGGIVNEGGSGWSLKGKPAISEGDWNLNRDPGARVYLLNARGSNDWEEKKTTHYH